MQAQLIATRKLGFLEKITVLFHELAAGSLSVSSMIKLETIIEFEQFKKGCQILFWRLPLLRAIIETKEQDYFFNFRAKFDDVPLGHIKNGNFADVMEEYGNGVVKPFDLNSFLWRATLVTQENEQCSYIVFGAVHAICDATSISYLLGELIRIIQELDNNKIPHSKSLPIPLSLDSILDITKFTPTIITETPPKAKLSFENKTSPDNAHSRNILKILSTEVFNNLLDSCRRHDTTITGALCAALAMSINEDNDLAGGLAFDIPFNLRPYTLKTTPSQILALYAHQLTCDLELKNTAGFWDVARHVNQKCQKAISEYTLQSVDNHKLFAFLSTCIKASFRRGNFFIPYTISNPGIVDNAFTGLNKKYAVKHFSFTILNHGLLGFGISAATLNGNLCLNFNYSSPAISEQSASRLIKRTVFYLTHQSVG